VGSESNTYRSDYTNAQLYELVRKAALKFGQPRPHKLSTRKFDAARAPLGEPKAPSGRWIAKRLDHPWPEVVRIALDAKRDVTMTDSAARRSPAEKWLDHRHLYFALNFVAKKRDARSFGAADYDITCADVRAAALRSGNTTLPMILPTSLQLIQIVRRIEKAEKEATSKAAKTEATEGNGDASADSTPRRDGSRARRSRRRRASCCPNSTRSRPKTHRMKRSCAAGGMRRSLSPVSNRSSTRACGASRSFERSTSTSKPPVSCLRANPS
jgi:hypothetical protein